MSRQSEKLFDGITHISDDLVEQAQRMQKKRQRKWLKWTGPVAAVLVVAILIGFLFGRGGSLAAYAITEAAYPSMAPYPEHEYLPGFDSRYEAWRETIDKQRAYFEAGEGLEDFFRATITEFLSGETQGNRVYSPLNVYMALAMLAEITDGESRAQILALLGSDSIESLRTQANAVWNANYRDDGAVESILASSLWLNDDVAFNRNTIDTLAENYYASSYRGKMGSDALNQAYRTWLNAQTGGLLKGQIDDKTFDAETLLAMVTTVYFRAKWSDTFNSSQTIKAPFYTDTVETGNVTADFMRRTDTYGTYYWGKKFSATRSRLDESGGTMWFILPDEGVSVEDLLCDSEALSFLLSNGQWQNNKELKIHLTVPKFDVQSQLDLKDELYALGVTNVFDWQVSDFSPLLEEKQPVILSRVQHGARVAIDEEGVTATAYTEMWSNGAAMPPEDEIDFTLNRPFLFVVTGADGLPLFVGIVCQPVI